MSENNRLQFHRFTVKDISNNISNMGCVLLHRTGMRCI
jgi:hypothetical protein